MSRRSKPSWSTAVRPVSVVTTWVSMAIESWPATRPAVSRNGRRAPSGTGASARSSVPWAPSTPPAPSPDRNGRTSAPAVRSVGVLSLVTGPSVAEGVLELVDQLRGQRRAGAGREQGHLVRDVAQVGGLRGDDPEHRAAADRGDQQVAVGHVDDDLVQVAELVCPGGAAG